MGTPAPPPGTNVNVQKAICHPDRRMVAKGLCNQCYTSRYRAQRKAEAVASGEVNLDGETGMEVTAEGEQVSLDRDFVNDPEATQEFYRIMWGWLRGAYREEKIGIPGTKVLDPKAMLQARGYAVALATKAASVLGRAYIAERRIEEKPEELPVAGMGDMIAGWGEVIKKVKDSARPPAPENEGTKEIGYDA